MRNFVARAFVGAAISGMVLLGAASTASAGPGQCGAPGRDFISSAAKEQGPNSGPNGNHWGPTRDAKPASPGQAVVGFCLLGLD